MHPLIKDKLFKDLKKLNDTPLVIMIIPLLFEAKLMDLCSEIWVVYCSKNQQLGRLMQRDGLSKNQSKQRINAQLSLAFKKETADITIDNSMRPEDLITQVNHCLARKS